MGSFFGNLFSSIVHNATSAAIGLAAPAVVGIVSGNGPTGGALDYAQSHPWVFALYGIATLVARDKLKNVPAFAQASGTVAPIDAAAAPVPTRHA